MIGQAQQIKLGSAKNYLIIKDDVGKSKPATRDLPADGFAYGRPDQTNQEGAAQVTTSWKYHTSKPLTDDNNPKNFK